MAPTFEAKPGDLIEISRWGYQHWAVYIGENEVVHLVNKGGRLLNAKAEVKREKLADVVAIPHFQVNNLLDEKYKARDPSIIVKEACVMVGHELQYNLVTYNSKHFAIEMRYGKANSWQVFKALFTGFSAVGVSAVGVSVAKCVSK